jgi:hypothetical protein
MSPRYQLGVRWTSVLMTLVTCAFTVPAWAQDPGSGIPAAVPSGDEWSFVITPQAWISHIVKNGFSADNAGLNLILQCGPSGEGCFKVSSQPNDALDPQWGLQFAAQKGRLSLAASFQYVTFETRNDITYDPADGLPRAVDARTGSGPLDFQTVTINPGDQFAQEFVNTTRIDFDLSASYFFADVVKDRLDLSVGGGFKFIYASSSRQYGNLSPTAATFNSFVLPAPGLYLVCHQDDCSDATFRQRVHEYSYIYGATIPMSAVLRLTNDAKWLLPLSLTPLIGAELRQDQDVVYEFVNQPCLTDCVVKRNTGPKFTFGFTADATVRWLINETFSTYAGMRVQFIEGFNQYLAYGALVGMSVRFGGK